MVLFVAKTIPLGTFGRWLIRCIFVIAEYYILDIYTTLLAVLINAELVVLLTAD